MKKENKEKYLWDHFYKDKDRPARGRRTVSWVLKIAKLSVPLVYHTLL